MKLSATTRDISVAWIEWQQGRLGKGQRFGQFIWNSFGKDGEIWDALFYSNDPTEAYVMAMLEVIGEATV